MMKERLLLSVIFLAISVFCNSQIGINTDVPYTTLEVMAKNSVGASVEVDGLLIPRVDRQRAQSMIDIPVSTLIYINNVSTGTQNGTTINVDNEGFYYFNGVTWLKLLEHAQGIPRQVLSVNVSGSQNIGNTPGGVTAEFTIKNIDIFNGWGNNIYTVPNNQKGIYVVNGQTANYHDVGGSRWFVISDLLKSTDDGNSWTTIISNTSANNEYGDVENGNTLFWTGELSGGDKLKVRFRCDSSTSNIVALGGLSITKL